MQLDAHRYCVRWFNRGHSLLGVLSILRKAVGDKHNERDVGHFEQDLGAIQDPLGTKKQRGTQSGSGRLLRSDFDEKIMKSIIDFGAHFVYA